MRRAARQHESDAMGLSVLCYCAINPHRRFVEAEQQIQQIRGYTTLIFDERDDPAEPWYETVLKKYRNARRGTLENDYDALFICESDMLIPSNALERLAKLDSPVAYGLYCWRHGWALWNSYVALNEDAGISLSDVLAMENAPNEWQAVQQGQPFISYGVGFGCTLIRRQVLEQIDFRNFGDATSFYCDWLFAADCNKLNVKQMHDPQVICGHIGDNGVYYPDLKMPELFRMEDRKCQVM